MNSWILNFQQFQFSLLVRLFPLTWLNFPKYFVHRTCNLSQFLLGPFINMTQKKYATIIWWLTHVLSIARLYRSWYRKSPYLKFPWVWYVLLVILLLQFIHINLRQRYPAIFTVQQNIDWFNSGFQKGKSNKSIWGGAMLERQVYFFFISMSAYDIDFWLLFNI
jgi:hypothetical protein